MGDVPFVVGLETGRAESAFMGKPMMLFFTSAKDKACLAFAERTWKKKDVLRRIEKFTPVLIDPDDDQKPYRRYDLSALPAVVWLEFEEQPIIMSSGEVPIAEFLLAAEEAMRNCPSARAPGGGHEVLIEQKQKLDNAVSKGDVKAQLAAIFEIRRIERGAAVQIATEAVDARLTKAGEAEIERAKLLAADKKKVPEAVKALEKLVADYGAEHAVAKKAQEALDLVAPKPKPKPAK